MNLYFSPSRKIFLTIGIFTLVSFLVLFTTLIVTSSYLFLNLASYKQKIEDTIYLNTGYRVTISHINTNISYRPELILNNIKIINPKNKIENLQIKKIKLVLSYKSLWQISPIFDDIKIDGSSLKLVLLKNNDITLNGLNLTQLFSKDKSNSFDIERLVLLQKNIAISNINFSYLDNTSNILQYKIININLALKNQNKQHNFNLLFTNFSQQKMLNINLKWQGYKEYLKNSQLKVQSYNNSPLKNKINFIFEPFNAQTVVDVKFIDNKLINLYANFDIKNFVYNISNLKQLNFPVINGKLNIKLLDNDTYIIDASNITIKTLDNYIFNNKKISGIYYLNKEGNINISHIDLTKFSPILKPFFKNIDTKGFLTSVNYSWHGNIFKPQKYYLNIIFNNLEFLHNSRSIINNINGKLTLARDMNCLDLNLTNSLLNYNKHFIAPIKIDFLSSKIQWYKQNNDLQIKILPTIVKNKDFVLNTSGEYNYSKNYIDLKVNLAEAAINKIYKYIPGIKLSQWLKDSLINGQVENVSLLLKGKLNDFPFMNNQGKFFIDANIKNAKLKFLKDWQSINNINAKFMLHNDKIIINAKSLDINHNKINNLTATIDSLQHNAYLTLDAHGYGKTQNFVNYLVHSPINKLSGNFLNQILATGSGLLNLHLTVPFNAPHKTKVSGDYKFQNNLVDFKLNIPKVSQLNGYLNFAETGVKIKNLKFTSLDSKLQLDAYKVDKNFHIAIKSNALNYKELFKHYMPQFDNLIEGQAQAVLNFDIHNGIDNLSFNSDLVGVKITAPEPLQKEKADVRAVSIKLKEHNIGFNYDKFITSNTHTGTLVSKLDFYANNIHLDKYVDLIKKATSQSDNRKSSSKELKDKSTKDISLQLRIKTDNFYIGNLNFNELYAKLYINANNVEFSLDGSRLSGTGKYFYKPQAIAINLKFLELLFAKQNNEVQKEEVKPEYNVNLTQLETVDYSQIFNSQIKTAKNNPITKAFDMPKTDFTIDKLTVNKQLIGNFKLVLNIEGSNLDIKNITLNNDNYKLKISGYNYCVECQSPLVDLSAKLTTNNMGMLLGKLGYNNIINGGSGTIKAHAQWFGRIDKYDIKQDIKNTVAEIAIVVKNGKFLQSNTGDIVGAILSIINFQTIINIVKLDFANVFAKGFSFDRLATKIYLINDNLYIKGLKITGMLAIINTYGTIDLKNKQINMYLTAMPNLTAGVAVGAAVATANPIVGIVTYVIEKLFNNPISKLFTFSFQVTGKIAKPIVKRIAITRQVLNNVSSAVDILAE